MSKPTLKVIKTTHRPVIDIYATWRAEIAARDWAGVHTSGDRNEPLDLSDIRKRSWRA